MRDRHRGRVPRRRDGARRGGDLSDTAGVLRRAVEAALAVARAGVTADPVVPPPQALKPYLTFSKLTSHSLDAIARVVDADDEFRTRVAAAVDEADVGHAGWLWLHRPEGWGAELAAIEADSAAKAADVAEQREERAAVRKLAATQAALARAESAAADAAAAAESLRVELLAERSARQAADAQLAEVATQLEQVAAERRDAVRSLKEQDARLTERGTLLNAARATIVALQAELRALSSTEGADVRAAHPGGGDGGLDEPASPAGVAPPDAPTSAVPTSIGRPTTMPAVPAAVVTGVAHAAEAAASLADALAAVAGVLEAAREGAAVPPTATTADEPTAVRPALAAPAAAEPSAVRAVRTPIALPGGVFDDSIEAAEHLLRTADAVLVVDGYNVTMTAWPELGKADQRRRLVAEVSDLAHRTSTPVEIVFDGAEVEPITVPAPLRALVRVRFSDPGVEADDVIIDLVGHLPAAVPVIVASSDKRVGAGVVRRGANVIKADQLVALLRR